MRELADQISGEHGVRVEWIASDLTDAADRDRIPGEVAERNQVVDMLINNAGMGTVGNFQELPIGPEIQMIRLNVEAMLALCGAFVPGMVERGRGGDLNVASVSGFMPVPRQATYAASKAFVLTFTESLTLDLDGTGVSGHRALPGAGQDGVRRNHRGLARPAATWSPSAWRARRSTASTMATGP